MFHKIIAAVTSIFATTFAFGQAPKEPQVAQLKNGLTLLTAPNPSKAAFAACQPLAGEAVEILRWVPVDPEKLPGLQAAHVRVLEGRCKSAEGFVGLEQLASAGKPSGKGEAR